MEEEFEHLRQQLADGLTYHVVGAVQIMSPEKACLFGLYLESMNSDLAEKLRFAMMKMVRLS